MKKKLLFLIDSLNLGGAEKSLVTLLNLLDYSRYDVDLLLFSQGGEFQELLPKEVCLLQEPEFVRYCGIPWKKTLKKLLKFDMALAQLWYSISIRKRTMDTNESAICYWECSKNCFKTLERKYDVAIAYGQRLPTFFVADKVVADKKIAWYNISYTGNERCTSYLTNVYDKYQLVNAVSDSVREQLLKAFDFPERKVTVMMDILDDDFAMKMARTPNNAELEMAGKGVKILTVGRLAYMKGYDLAIDAAKRLRDRGFDFTWYVVGEGEQHKELQNQIAQNQLEGQFILLGSRVNPYPYFQLCDLYVQPSRFEGFGITLAEAKMFHKPIVVTNFDAVNVQFRNEENALIVDISSEAIADGIMRMMTDCALREKCTRNVMAEKKGNREEMRKLYEMIEGIDSFADLS